MKSSQVKVSTFDSIAQFMVDQIIYKTKDDVLNAIRAIDSNKLTVGDLMEIIKKASAQPTFATNADTVFLLYSGSLDPN
ncbi:hypothetical protein B9T12_09620 [Wohlfahrtiimonas chitiniclastica]|uniref:hypothetical protein n=1 Tax=Wohlfahrtiimonas chitiniclastica TaxID=400946 RepID=UPI000B98413C|nr:hypothetical protein [Wohlfahrtiimonas chitiniclastica]OYQ77081.1 hypothetical protein B9T12_09620 [Wohlfahrtiimonas chitiniclastica]